MKGSDIIKKNNTISSNQASLKLGKIVLCAFTIELLIVLTYLIISSFILQSDRSRYDNCKCIKLEDNWTIVYESGEIEGINLPKNVDTDEFKYSIYRPFTLDESNSDYIVFWNKGQLVNIYIDDTLIYEYNLDSFEKYGKDMPYQYIFVQIPKDMSIGGKILKFELTAVNNIDRGHIGEIYVGDKTAILINIFSIYQYEAIAAMMLLVLSTTTILGAIYISIKNRKQNGLLDLGLSIFATSAWLIADSRLRQFFIPNESIARNIAFLSLATVPIMFALYVDKIQNEKFHKLFVGIEILGILNFIITFLLHITGIAALSEIVASTFITCLISIIVLIGTFTVDYIKDRIKNYRLVAIAFIIFGISAILQIFFYSVLGSSATSGIFVASGLVVLTIMCTIFCLQQLSTLNKEKDQLKEKSQSLSKEAMLSLAKTVDAKDKYTSGHSQRVAKYSKEIASRLGYTPEEQEDIYYIGLLHDVGKIGIPDEIINKRGSLSYEEFEKVKQHTIIGAEILENITSVPNIVDGVRHHHERYDGNGYPDNLSGDSIPMIARIITVADAYDAMSSNRSYRNQFNQTKIKRELELNKYTQFDPLVVDVMLSIIDEDKTYELCEQNLINNEKNENQ